MQKIEKSDVEIANAIQRVAQSKASEEGYETEIPTVQVLRSPQTAQGTNWDISGHVPASAAAYIYDAAREVASWGWDLLPE